MIDSHLINEFYEALERVSGYIYPNEIELQWSVLIVLYPYITGLVAGAFILASLVRVFKVDEMAPAYRLALLTSLAFLLVAPMPLNAHLGHPERAYEILVTPNTNSAMAMFGFVYLWYLTIVLLLEVWFDYRKDIVILSKTKPAPLRWFYKILTLGVDDISPRALALDDKIGRAITVIGVPSAVLLHGYVGFIFGSIKAIPWWSTALMPIIFLFSAMVSGIAAVMVIYMFSCWLRGEQIVGARMKCVDTIARYLLVSLIVSFSLEALEMIQKAYEAEEHYDITVVMLEGMLYLSMLVVQVFLGSIVPMIFLGFVRIANVHERVRKAVYAVSSLLILLGVLAMRWNVVIGGQFVSKSFRGITTYKLGIAGREGLLSAAIILILPVLILAVLVKLFPPWESADKPTEATAGDPIS
ncbi:polysulfide reductase NrfD [bacterium]|nr:polysulfide reductase NrfD [bacterium]